jgi:hypothetical protein
MLREVCEAVEASPLFALRHRPPNPECTVGGHIQPALRSRLGKTEEALTRELGDATVAEVARDVLELNVATRSGRLAPGKQADPARSP